MRIRLFLAVGAVAVLVGCGSGPPKGGTASSAPVRRPSAGAGCSRDAARGTQARFTNQAGVSLAGVLLGDGPRGVVLAHQSEGDVCQWLPFGRQLADAGYRVLAFDFAGNGASDQPRGDAPLDADVVAATGYLRQHGAAAVVLVGASMGGTAVVGAAATVSPPVNGVVSLSGPAVYGGVDAQRAAARLRVPVLYAAGEQDETFAANARAMYDATPASVARTLLVVPSHEHGVDFVNDFGDTSEQVKKALLDFLARYDKP